MRLILGFIVLFGLIGCDQEATKKDANEASEEADGHDDECLNLHGGGDDECITADDPNSNDPIPVDDDKKEEIEDEIDDEFPDPPVTSCNDSLGMAKGAIAADATWDSAIEVSEDVTVNAGVTLTLDECARVSFASGARLIVEGTLTVTGKESAFSSFNALVDGESWGGIAVESGGTVSLTYAFIDNADTAIDCKTGATACDIKNSTIKGSPYVKFASKGSIDTSLIAGMQNKGVSIDAGADVTIVNSKLHKPIAGDVLGQNGGSLSIDKSSVGDTDYEHCAIHINAADSLSVTNSILTANEYAIMLGNVDGAVFNHNNFKESNAKHFLKIGNHSNTDLTGNYWEGGVQDVNTGDFTGTNSDLSNPSDTAFDDVGPDW